MAVLHVLACGTVANMSMTMHQAHTCQPVARHIQQAKYLTEYSSLGSQ
jgi:hypothetical protein